MHFSVESWDPSYGSAVEALDLEVTSETVDADVELPADQWAPVAPGSAAVVPGCVLFVDGVRRIDARVWISHDGLSRPGVCATVAAGAVRAEGNRAEVVATGVRRGLYASPDGAAAIETPFARYELVACDGSSPEAVYLAIHQQMTALEQQVSAGLEDAELIVVDGPLRGRNAPNMVGYVKTQHVHYLSEDHQRVMGALTPGTRTPLFLIEGRMARYSWYVRLPGPMAHPLAAIVRCEVPGVGDVPDVARRASAITTMLQRFASEAHKDARAPQNLYPIAGLESDLRRRLGDARLLERHLRAAGAASAAGAAGPATPSTAV